MTRKQDRKNSVRLPANIRDTAVALVFGLLLLMLALSAYQTGMSFWVDEVHFFTGSNPLAQVAAARLLLFALCALPAGLLFGWIYLRVSATARLDILISGASLSAFLFLLMQDARGFDPMPWWFDVTRAALLFLAMPAGWYFARGHRAA